MPQVLDFDLTKAGDEAAIKCLNQGVERAENLAVNFTFTNSTPKYFWYIPKAPLYLSTIYNCNSLPSKVQWTERTQNSHYFVFCFFFSVWVFLCGETATTFRECLHNPFWVTRKSLTICLRPGIAQNSSKALLLLSMHLSLPLHSQGFSSWQHCSQERAFSCPLSFMVFTLPWM